jgi:hypothetical protein
MLDRLEQAINHQATIQDESLEELLDQADSLITDLCDAIESAASLADELEGESEDDKEEEDEDLDEEEAE